MFYRYTKTQPRDPTRGHVVVWLSNGLNTKIPPALHVWKDPTPPSQSPNWPSMATLDSQYTTLQKFHQWQATHKSHGAFISSCLHNHVIPQGLKIKTSPSVPKINMLQRTLHNKWRAIVNRTSYTLLKLLKRYHQDVITTLTNEINSLEARLRGNSGLTPDGLNLNP